MEKWDLYTKDRVKTGETVARGEEIQKGKYRMVVHVCIFNSKGQMLIQQREKAKTWSELWDISVGGHAIVGESSNEAAQREVMEEIGLELKLDRPSLTVNFENGFDDIFLVNRDIELSELKLQPEEVKAVQWASMEEIKRMIADEVFIPYYNSYIEMLFDMRNKMGAHFRDK